MGSTRIINFSEDDHHPTIPPNIHQNTKNPCFVRHEREDGPAIFGWELPQLGARASNKMHFAF
jgi:hypothetical protein